MKEYEIKSWVCKLFDLRFLSSRAKNVLLSARQSRIVKFVFLVRKKVKLPRAGAQGPTLCGS